MNYKTILSNAEIMLLQIIAEIPRISGYEINKLILKRGYKEWANIGQTSVYVGLKKLNTKKLIIACTSKIKKGKGPAPIKYEVSRNGMQFLKKEILRLLSNSKEREQDFDLGVAGIPLCNKNDIFKALNQRKNFLENYSKEIKEKFDLQGGERLPLHVKSLFTHPLFLIEKELEFLNNLIINLKKEKI